MQLKNTKIKVPRLGISRFGVYYLRCSVQDAMGRRKVIQHSLKTKDAAAAKLAALRFSMALIEGEAMTSRHTPNSHATQRYEIDIERGTIKSEGPEDHERAMAALDAMARVRALQAKLVVAAPMPAIQGAASVTPNASDISPVEVAAQRSTRAAQPGACVGEGSAQAGQAGEADPSGGLAAVGAQSHALQLSLAASIAAEILAQSGQVVTQVSPGSPSPILPSQAAQAAVPLGIKLKEALQIHLQEEQRMLKEGSGTFEEKRSILNEFLVFFGDIYLNDITPEQIASRWRPAEFERPNRKYKNKLTSLARLEKRRGYLHKFFDWAKETGRYRHENPMGAKMATKKVIRRDAKPHEELTRDDLGKLFSAKFRDEMTVPDWYWLPLIALFSAARLTEVSDRALDDFEVVEGCKVIKVADAKTPEGRRLVPIHSALLELGFWDYIEALKARGCTRLFPHRPLIKGEKMVGRKWNLWVRACGLAGQNKTFHSLRVTAITDMHNAGANPAGIHRVAGHTTDAVKGAHGQYVRSITLEVNAQTVEALRYEGIDLSALRREDPTFKAYFDKVLSPEMGGIKASRKAKLERHLAAKAEREQRMQRQRRRQPGVDAQKAGEARVTDASDGSTAAAGVDGKSATASVGG